MPPKGPRSKRGSSFNQPLNENVKKLKVDNLSSPEVFDSNRPFSYALKSVIGDEIEELEKFVKSKHLRVVELEKKCSEYEKDIYEKISDLQNLTRNYKLLESTNEKLRANLARYENEKGRKPYDLQVKYRDDDLTKQQVDNKLKYLEKEQNDLKAQLSKELNNKSKLESIVIEKDEKISNLRNQTEILVAKCKEIEKAKGQEKFAHVEKHKSRIEELEFEKEELLRKLDIKDARISEQETCTSNTLKRLEEERNDTEFFRNKLCESEVALKQNDDILKQKSLEIERLSESAKEEIAFYRDQVTELDASFKYERNRKELLAKELLSSEDKVLKLEGELKHMKNVLKTRSMNDEEEQLNIMEELKLLKIKSNATEDDLLETRNSLNILHEDYNSLKELHSKCQQRMGDPGPSKSSRLDMEALRSELKKTKEDYDILHTQKNMAESETTILKRKLTKLEASKKEVELGLKKELDDYKILKDEEVDTFRQNFNPAAKKTIDVLKDEKKSLSCQIEKYKTDVEKHAETIKEYEELIERLRRDLFNAEKSALESSISEHKEVIESLQQMPERYRRKTLRRLLNKSEENISVAVADDVSKESGADSNENKDGSLNPEVISPEKSKQLPQSENPDKAMNLKGLTEPTQKIVTAEDSRTLSVSDLDKDTEEVIQQRLKSNRKDESQSDSTFKIPKRTRESGGTDLESYPASKVQMVESPSEVQPMATSLVKNHSRATPGKPRDIKAYTVRSSNPPTASSTRYASPLPSSERTSTKPPSGRPSFESSKSSNPSKPINNPLSSSTSQHPLMDKIDNFTATLTKQRTKETETELAVREAVGDLESQGFFSQEKLQKESTEAKFVTYFLRKYKDSDPTFEKKKNEIDQTIQLYANRIRQKMNKTI